MHNFNEVGSAILLIYDTLKKDKESKTLIKTLDKSKSDSEIKIGIAQAIKRLRELNKNDVADTVEIKTKDFIKQ